MGQRTAELELIERLSNALDQWTAQTTAVVAQLAGLSLNSVLRSELVVFDASGYAEMQSAVPYASVGCIAYGQTVTLSANGHEGTPPTRGIGVIAVPAGKAVVWPLTGTTLGVYGTAGERALVTIWSAPQVPSFGGTASGVDGGGA